mgnify:CR=1 FL=1
MSEQVNINEESEYYLVLRETSLIETISGNQLINSNSFKDAVDTPTNDKAEIYNLSLFSIDETENLSIIEYEDDNSLEIESSEKEELEEELYEIGLNYWANDFIRLSKSEGTSIALVEKQVNEQQFLKWSIPINKLETSQKIQCNYSSKESQNEYAENFIWIEEWEKISLINEPIDVSDGTFDPSKVKVSIIREFDSKIKNFVNCEELLGSIIGFSYNDSEVYLDQGDGDGATYSATCKTINN